MKTLTNSHFGRMRMIKQRGVVLFFTLIALLAMSLAAVALIRSADTSTMIAGNLAFKQAATTSGDAGIEAAVTWLAAQEAAAALARAGTNNNVLNDITHPFNATNAANGYYSNADPALNLFADATWDAITAIPAVIDNSGNSRRYIIQRMCRTANQLPQNPDCLFSGAPLDLDDAGIKKYSDICDGPGCPVPGTKPQIRITARTTGPKSTVSYVQAFVY